MSRAARAVGRQVLRASIGLWACAPAGGRRRQERRRGGWRAVGGTFEVEVMVSAPSTPLRAAAAQWAPTAELPAPTSRSWPSHAPSAHSKAAQRVSERTAAECSQQATSCAGRAHPADGPSAPRLGRTQVVRAELRSRARRQASRWPDFSPAQVPSK